MPVPYEFLDILIVDKSRTYLCYPPGYTHEPHFYVRTCAQKHTLVFFRILWYEWFAVSGGRFRNLLQRTDKFVVNRPTNPDPIVPTWEVVSSKRETTP